MPRFRRCLIAAAIVASLGVLVAEAAVDEPARPPSSTPAPETAAPSAEAGAVASPSIAESPAQAAAEPAAVPPGGVRYGKPRQLAMLANQEICESSGLAVSRLRPDVFWTHNDSGGGPRLYAFGRGGEHLATCTVKGAAAHDWEDMASFRRGDTSFLLIADIGDNLWSRKRCSLYVIEEPPVGTAEKPVTATARVHRQIDFVYAEGPRDCEAVAVDPAAGRVYLVTKEGLRCKVYELDVPELAGPQAAGDSPSDGDPPPAPGPQPPPVRTARLIGQVQSSPMVAMDMSPDGRRALLLTYADAWEVVRGEKETWRDAFARPPRKVVMPQRNQGESVCYGADGRTLYLTSEFAPTPLLEVPAEPDAKDPAP
ncbi:MAG: hypothetical protein ISS74_02580 [Planctomycetes bacterium]|nr:hypothetical protein [Planctomycetota bacterium]